MKHIFLGMLLVLFNFNLDIGAIRIGLVPTFLGYIFMHKGLVSLADVSPRFSRVLPACKGMVVFFAVVYALNLFGLSPLLPAPRSPALALIVPLFTATIVPLYIHRGMIQGIKDIESTREQNLGSGNLSTVWWLLLATSFAVFSLSLHTALATVGIVAALSVCHFVLSVCHLFLFYKTQQLFHEEPTPPPADAE